MFGWIDRWFVHPVASAINDVLNIVHSVIRGVYGFIHGLNNILWYAWGDVYNGAVSIWKGARAFAAATYHRFIHLYRSVIPYLESYTHWVLTLLGKVIGEARTFLYNLILSTYHWALATFDATRKWAVNEIWNPLFKSLTSAWQWLTHEGATMWHYFTHLADLAEVLFWHILQSLENHAWDAGKLLGRFFMSLFWHNRVRFLTLLEDILDAIL
jgi:hypothetical protein